MTDKRPSKMTLKEYIHSNSLRKQALSRANSRESSKNDPATPVTPSTKGRSSPFKSPSPKTRE